MGLVLVGGFLFPIYNLFSNYSEFVIKYSSQLFIILELSNILISIRPSECSLTIRDAILELTYICIPFNINQNSNTIWNSVLNFTFIYWVSFIISNHSRRKIEKRMSICLTWFPINDFRLNQYIPESGWFYKNVGFYLEGCRGRGSILPWNKVTIPFISNSLPNSYFTSKSGCPFSSSIIKSPD